jgi:mannose-6-phosphate isomerase-like protein (cupin superfamily)
LTGATGTIAILDGAAGPRLPIVEGGGEARAVVWPGVGAHARSLHHLWLSPGGRTVPLSHLSEAVYYVIAGDGSVVDRSSGETQPLRAGAMFHVDPETVYVAEAGGAGLELVGGPAPADASLYYGLEGG